MTNPLYVLVDLALAILAIRSIALVRTRSPFTVAGWALAFGYGLTAAIEFSSPALHKPASQVAYGFLIALAVAFVIAGIRDEPQGEPWWWPVRIGPTRAERRRPT